MENIKKLDELKWNSALPGANPASAEIKISYDLKILQRYTRRVYLILEFWHQICFMSG
jgi:hypothetical protein